MIDLVEHAEGIVLAVRAHAAARRSGVEGIHDGMLKVSVTQASIQNSPACGLPLNERANNAPLMPRTRLHLKSPGPATKVQTGTEQTVTRRRIRAALRRRLFAAVGLCIVRRDG